MTNFDGIKQMNSAAMEAFLDQVYLAGLNTGIYAAGLDPDGEEQAELLDENPFDQVWLSSKAEAAVSTGTAPDGDDYMLNALTAAILRGAGIETPDLTDRDTE